MQPKLHWNVNLDMEAINIRLFLLLYCGLHFPPGSLSLVKYPVKKASTQFRVFMERKEIFFCFWPFVNAQELLEVTTIIVLVSHNNRFFNVLNLTVVWKELNAPKLYLCLNNCVMILMLLQYLVDCHSMLRVGLQHYVTERFSTLRL
jgi:hypothetical protein